MDKQKRATDQRRKGKAPLVKFHPCWLTCTILFLTVSSLAHGTVQAGCNIEKISPDGRLIVLNGSVGNPDGQVLGWIYEWGDGSTTDGFFPAVHRYQNPGTYKIRLTAYGDDGSVANAQVEHVVPALKTPSPSDIRLSTYALGLKPGDSSLISIEAQPQGKGQTLNTIEAFTIQRQVPAAHEVLNLNIEDQGIRVTANRLSNAENALCFLYVYVNEVEAIHPVSVVVNNSSEPFRLLQGKHCVAYLPTSFLEESSLDGAELARIIDLAIENSRTTMRGEGPEEDGLPVMQTLSYDKEVYGTSGNPLSLGKYAFPQDGVPPFDVIMHEMGHNFSSCRTLFHNFANPGPFYQETIAEWFKQMNLEWILEKQAGELSPHALEMLKDMKHKARARHDQNFQQYVAGGMKFQYSDIAASHVLVKNIYDLCDRHGWDKLGTFMDQFHYTRLPAYSEIIGRFGGLSEKNRITCFIAALSVTFGQDFLETYRRLSFPVDQTLYNTLTAAMTAGHQTDHPDGVQP